MQRFITSKQFRPDPDGFKMPWKRYGKFSEEVMKARYNQLHNFSKGLHVRLTGHG